MKYFILSFLSLFLLNCATNKLPKSFSVGSPIQAESKLSKDEVWEKLVDYLALKGVVIKILDKESGILTTETVSLIKNFTTVDKKTGNVIDQNKYVVVPKNFRNSAWLSTSGGISGQWNVRIKNNKNTNGTTISVNMVNLAAYREFYDKKTGYSYANYEIETTHVFENELINLLK